MSELTVTLLRLGYLVLLWAFVLSTIAVLRRDLYGTRIVSRRRPATVPAGRAPTPNASSPPPVADAARGGRGRGPSRLVVTEGPLRGTTLPLGTSAVMVGRAPSCTLVLDDDYSSSRHARIFLEGDQWYVEDLGSTNGTFLEERPVTQAMPVRPGAPIRVGQSVIELQR